MMHAADECRTPLLNKIDSLRLQPSSHARAILQSGHFVLDLRVLTQTSDALQALMPRGMSAGTRDRAVPPSTKPFAGQPSASPAMS